MTRVTETDLKRLENLIIARFDEIGRGQTEIKERLKALEDGQKALEIGQVELKGQIAVVDARLKAVETASLKIPDLIEKVGELKNWKQIAIVVITAALSGSITWFIRGDK